MKPYQIATMVLATVLVGCSDGQTPDTSSGSAVMTAPPRVERPRVAQETLALGKQVFDANCAACHGDRGQGAPNWQKPGPDGKYPAPPLNGTGHAWHHPMAALQQTIRNGTLRIGGSMPPWKGKLSEEEIQAVIYWFQSKWPDELYAAWKEADDRSQPKAN